jgi:hypothetical protein
MGQHRHADEPHVFVLSGRADGADQLVPSGSPSAAAEQLSSWLRQDAAARISWVVNQAWQDWILLAARLRPARGLGESLRVTHLFTFEPGDQVGPRLLSQCGAEFSWWALEFGDELDTPLGAPCVACELTVLPAQAETRKALPPLDGDADTDTWNGWDRYYQVLGWPVEKFDGRLMLVADSDNDVTVLSVPADLAEQVQSCLARTDMQAPLLQLPGLPAEALFVVARTSVPVTMPPGVHRVPVGIPLPPSTTVDGPARWITSPGDVQLGRSRDLDVLACIYRLSPPQRQELVS